MSASLSIEAHEIGSSLFRMNYSLSQETRTSICLTRGVRWSFNTCLIVAVLSSYVGVGESLRHVKGMQRVSITQRFSGSIEKWTHFTIVRACSWFGLLDTLPGEGHFAIFMTCAAPFVCGTYISITCKIQQTLLTPLQNQYVYVVSCDPYGVGDICDRKNFTISSGGRFWGVGNCPIFLGFTSRINKTAAKACIERRLTK